jgi:hypothetical protein
LGFYLYNSNYRGSTTRSVTINANRIVDTVPIITVNNNLPDTPFFLPSSFTFSGINPDKSLNYKIIYANDTLADSLFLPKAIDSLFLNGNYLSEDSLFISVILNYNCDSFKLNWKDDKRSEYYRVYIYSDKFYGGSQTIITQDTCLTVKFNWAKDIQNPYIDNGNINITKINQRSISAEPWADRSSREMFIYYQIESPYYGVSLSFERIK